MNKQRLIRKFDKQASFYTTRRLTKNEAAWRRKLLADAQGHVLELAVGAGASFPFYPQGVKLTAVDFSEQMLQGARMAAHHRGLDVTFLRADIEELAFPYHSFDTVVSTLSMCGYENPIHVLGKMRKWCKPDGRILLLEHGRGSNAAIYGLQKAVNPLLHRIIGCHQTRDIQALVHAAGLEVERLERHMAGMFYVIWAKPGKEELE